MGPAQQRQNGMGNGSMGAGMAMGSVAGGMGGNMGVNMAGGMLGGMGATMGGPQSTNPQMTPQPQAQQMMLQKNIIGRLRQQPSRAGWQSMYNIALRAQNCFQMWVLPPQSTNRLLMP